MFFHVRAKSYLFIHSFICNLILYHFIVYNGLHILIWTSCCIQVNLLYTGQPQPGQPGRRRAPLPGRVEFPLPGQAMGLPPTNNGAQASTDGAPAQVILGSSGCVPDCANGGTCRNGKCVCRPGVTGDACQNGAWFTGVDRVDRTFGVKLDMNGIVERVCLGIQLASEKTCLE